MKNNFLNVLMFLVGILMSSLMLVLLLTHKVLPINIVKAIPIVIAILLGIFMLISILQFATSKHTLTRLATLPIILTTFLIGFFLIKLPVYQMLISAMTGEEYEVNTELLFSNMSYGFKVFQIGIWISILPMIISAILLSKKSSFKTPKNIDQFYPRKAIILSCTYSNIRINNNNVYQLDLEIQDYDEIYTVSKYIKDLHYKLYTYQSGDLIEVLIDPNKKSNVVIENNGTYI